MKRAPLGEISRRKPLGEITMAQADTTEDHQEQYKQQQRHPQQQPQQQHHQQQEQQEQHQSENEHDHPQPVQPHSFTHGNPSSPSREEYSCTSDEEESRHDQGRQHILRSRLQEPEPKSREHYPEWCGPQRRGSRYLFSMIHRSQRIDLEREVSSAEEIISTRPRLLWSEDYDPNLSPDISDWDDDPALLPWPTKAGTAERDDEPENAQQHAVLSYELDTKDPQMNPSALQASSSTEPSIPIIALEVKASVEQEYEVFEELAEEADDEREDDDEGHLRKRRRTPGHPKGSPPATLQPSSRSKESAASDEGYFDIIAASRLPCTKDIPEAGPSSAAIISAPITVFHVMTETLEIEKALHSPGDNVRNSTFPERGVDIKESIDKEKEDLLEIDGGKSDKANISDLRVQSPVHPQDKGESSGADPKEQLEELTSGQELQTGGDELFEAEDVDYEEDAGADLSAYYDGDTKLSAVLNDEDESDKENYEPVDPEDGSPREQPVEGRAHAIKDKKSDQENAPICTATLHPPILEEDEESDKENQEPTYVADEQLHGVVQDSDDERESIESEVFIVGDDESEGPSDKVGEAEVSKSKYPLYFDDSGFGHSECFDGACSPSGLVLEAESSVHEPFYRNETPCTPLSRIGSRYSDAGLDADFDGTLRSDDDEQGRYDGLSTPRSRVFVSGYVSENEAERDDDVASTLGEKTPRQADRPLHSDCPPTISRGYTCEALVSIQEEHFNSSRPNPFSNDKAISSRTASYQLQDGDNSENDNEDDLVSPFLPNRRASSEHQLKRKGAEVKETIVFSSGALNFTDKGNKHPREVEYNTTTTNRGFRRNDKRRRAEPAQPIITLPVPVGSICDRGEIITPAVTQVYVPRRLDFSQPRAQPPLLRPFAGPLADARGWKAHQETVTIAANTTNTSTVDTTAATTTTTTTTSTNDAAWRICKVRVKTTLSAAEIALQRK